MARSMMTDMPGWGICVRIPFNSNNTSSLSEKLGACWVDLPDLTSTRDYLPTTLGFRDITASRERTKHDVWYGKDWVLDGKGCSSSHYILTLCMHAHNPRVFSDMDSGRVVRALKLLCSDEHEMLGF
ncbi:hypothetical protein VTL71DRAFT_8221 [Oculimacula yallundae]|uniref:Uncharacterized protein n=1 Tax=Oculimacula yallundae TaxID=86028 RepID=A0ABR4CX91_9HELO